MVAVVEDDEFPTKFPVKVVAETEGKMALPEASMLAKVAEEELFQSVRNPVSPGAGWIVNPFVEPVNPEIDVPLVGEKIREAFGEICIDAAEPIKSDPLLLCKRLTPEIVFAALPTTIPLLVIVEAAKFPDTSLCTRLKGMFEGEKGS